jgi:hypothetical protein
MLRIEITNTQTYHNNMPRGALSEQPQHCSCLALQRDGLFLSLKPRAPKKNPSSPIVPPQYYFMDHDHMRLLEMQYAHATCLTRPHPTQDHHAMRHTFGMTSALVICHALPPHSFTVSLEPSAPQGTLPTQASGRLHASGHNGPMTPWWT